MDIDGVTFQVNHYFKTHPEMVLGAWSRKDTLYGGEGFSITSNGDLAQQLQKAVEHLPASDTVPSVHSVQDRRHEETEPFTLPPPERHISEGSFYVAADKVIYQVEGGSGEPVNYCGVLLKANGTPQARRISHLIELRDHARRVLQSQNEGWPEPERNKVRRELNHAYDCFVAAYGPINKTTLTSTADGNVIRRMPNLVKFREDPDAMLVMALEEYDEVTGEAKKAPILRRDVVGKPPPITSVASAEEGLLVSLDRTGSVDLPFIAKLYGKPEPEVITELGDLIYLDPETNSYQTADEYLSGNVRHKLAAAEQAGTKRNIEDLQAVQPEDVLPGEIDANLGAPWIPGKDIQAFAADLFQVAPGDITVAHLARDAIWSVEGSWSAQQSVAATSDYGTARANGLWLLEHALNMKSPVIYDPDPADPDKRIQNPEATLAAKEKQKAIKERFHQWIFADPDRAERLVRAYNDTYNCMRPRVFDGSHLEFAGMSNVFELRPHQKDAIWRGMSGGNTLLAHAVGAGKTAVMCATAMKLKQAGLAKKSLIAVPNHMLEQFAREFQQLYPNAKLLVATKDDFARDRRKFLTAKIASGDWDAIIVTHSSFERIGMSRGFQAKFLREQITQYEQLLCERAANSSKAARNIRKTLEKQKAAREAKLKDLLAQDKKDDGVCFDEIGVDHLFIDEAHYFKNLETPTKMERVAGIQTGGSERAFDLYMKCRYLDELHAGHGVTFATGTPISNSLVELYTMQRFLDPEGLRSRGIEHFDAWAATFGEVVESMEISPDGQTLKPRSRFARFVNLPELQQMWRAFADVQTAEMLNLPRLEGSKVQVISRPMTDEQARLQKELVARYERIRNGGVDPRDDNALAITTDGRKLALDARMLSASAPRVPDTKLEAMLDKTAEKWKESGNNRSTQMIFCDMGVHPTAWGYCVYDQIIDGLVQRGIPREQIACIGDAESDAKKQALFERVRQGSIRVLIGSTAKLGTGTNVQKRLIAMHHLDAPWKPAEVEQRDGRILRQGNENAEVAVYRYVTEGSFDAFMWQALETKAKFISQLMTADSGVRCAEDIGGQELSYAEVKAIASGNPAVLTLAEADAELQRLGILRRNHADEQFIARRKLKELPETSGRLEKRLHALTSDQDRVFASKGEPLIIGGKVNSPDEAMAPLARQLESVPAVSDRKFPLGKYQGLTFGVEWRWDTLDVYLMGETESRSQLSKGSHGARAVLNALQRIMSSYAERIDAVTQELELARTQQLDYQARLGKPFRLSEYLEKLTALRDQLKVALSEAPAQGEPTTEELAEQINLLKAAHTVDVTPTRMKTPKLRVESTGPESPTTQAEDERPGTAGANDSFPPRHRAGTRRDTSSRSLS